MIKAVKALFNEILKFIRSDFHWFSYSYTVVLVALTIFLNYKFDLYNQYIKPSYFDGSSIWVFPLLYTTLYMLAAIPIFWLRKENKLLRTWAFYLKSLFIICIYGFSIGYFGYSNWHFDGLVREEILFIYRLISQLKGTIFYLIPLLLLKWFVDRDTVGLYGLTLKAKYINGYLILFLLLFPALVGMSFTPDFQIAYPQFKPWNYENIFGLATWQYTALFETSYSIDFVMTELMFRGALVIGMISIIGKNAILPMCVLYVAIHFGKPLGETVSSLFGGYILGALAFQTRHIWGGVIVHVFIGLTMEIMGFIQHYTHLK